MRIILFSGYKPWATVSYFYKYLKRLYPDTVFVSYDKGADFYVNSKKINLKKIFKEIFEPDLFIYVETDPGDGFWIEDILEIKIKKACWLIDNHLNFKWHKNFAKLFDYVFFAQKAVIPWAEKYGIKAEWLPLACDPEIHKEWFKEKEYDIVFVGHLNKEREKFFKEIEKKLKGIKIKVEEKIYLEEMAKIQSKGKIGFNLPVRKDLNMRTFEAPACGSLLFSPYMKHLDEIFNEDEIVIYKNRNEIFEKIEFYLINKKEWNEKREKGMRKVHKEHNYLKRVQGFLEKVKGEKQTTKNYFDFYYLTFKKPFKKYRKAGYFFKILKIGNLIKNLYLEMTERAKKKLNKFPY